MEFSDYADFREGLLRLPFKGKEYVIPEVGAADAITIRLARDDNAAGNTAALVEVNRRMVDMFLGAVHAEMVADNVPQGFIDRALVTAIADFNFGRIGALQAWRTGRSPEDLAAFVAASQEIVATS